LAAATSPPTAASLLLGTFTWWLRLPRLPALLLDDRRTRPLWARPAPTAWSI